ncbi:hypothetical protein D3C84_658660 [compost metagenome]
MFLYVVFKTCVLFKASELFVKNEVSRSGLLSVKVAFASFKLNKTKPSAFIRESHCTKSLSFILGRGFTISLISLIRTLDLLLDILMKTDCWNGIVL